MNTRLRTNTLDSNKINQEIAYLNWTKKHNKPKEEYVKCFPRLVTKALKIDNLDLDDTVILSHFTNKELLDELYSRL